MSQRSDLLQLPVHPHQIEVQEFETYDLIVDLRNAGDYSYDHIPGAINIPWAGLSHEPVAADGVASVGQSGAAEIPATGAYALHARMSSLEAGAAVLLYSGKGGADSAEAAVSVEPLGYTVDLIAGGWPTYRRWVSEGLRVLGGCLQPRWIRSAPCGLSQAVLEVLRERGEQVCCFASVAGPGPLPGLMAPGCSALSQDAFDTRLLDVLRRHDPSRTVWFDEVHRLGSAFRLPGELMNALRCSAVLRPIASLTDRARLVRRHIESLGSVSAFTDALHPVLIMVDEGLADEVSQLLLAGRIEDALAALLARGTDLLVDDESAAGETHQAEAVLALADIEASSIAQALLACVPHLLEASAEH